MENAENNQEFESKAIERLIKKNPKFAEYYRLRNEFIEKYRDLIKKGDDSKKAA